MNKYGIKILFFLVLLSQAACTQSGGQYIPGTLPYYKEASFTPYWFDNKADLQDFHKIPAFQLVDQLGDTITEADVADKIYVADFFFTSCPGICPQMTDNMLLLQQAFADDDRVVLLSHSVNPTADSVAQLQAYATDKGINADKWHLLTGDRKQIYDLGRYSYFVEEDQGIGKTEMDFLHTENFVLVDQDRHVRGIYNGLNKTSVQQLITDIRALEGISL